MPKAASALAQKRLDAAIMRNRRRIEETQGKALATALSRYFLSMVGRLRLPAGSKDYEWSAIELKVKEVKAGGSAFPSGDSLLDWATEQAKLDKVVHKAYVNIGEDVYAGVASAIGVELDFGLSKEFPDSVLKEIGAGVRNINQSSRVTVNNIVKRGLAAGSSPSQIAKELIGSIQGWGGGASGTTIAHSRAMVVARTETAIAYNRSAVSAFTDSGIIKKVKVLDAPTCGWTAHDDPDSANGKIVDLQTAFAQPVSHPNCVRAFSPVVASFDEAPAKKLSAAEQEKLAFDNVLEAMSTRSAGTYEERVAGQKLVDARLAEYNKLLEKRFAQMKPTELRAELDRIRVWDNTLPQGEMALRMQAGPMIQDAIYNLTQKLAWEKRVAFEGPVESFGDFKRINSFGPRAEEATGLRSRWFGALGNEETEAKVAAWAKVDGSMINIGKAASQYAEADLRKVELHELLHTMSDRSFGKAGSWSEYGSWAGWEEGVVERMAQLIEGEVFPDLRRGYNSYHSYTSLLQEFVNALSRAETGKFIPTASFERKFFQDLLELPIGQREAYVKKRLKKAKLTIKQFQKAFDYLKGPNRATS